MARTDFEPVPQVDSVLLHITQRSTPLLASQEAVRYQHFVRYGFTQWKKDLRTSYKALFTHRQWLGLYNAFCRYVPRPKQQPIYR